MGIAGAVNMPVGSALLLDLAPAERRQSVLALNYTVMSVAYTLGVTPAGYVAEQGYGLLARAERRAAICWCRPLCLRSARPAPDRASVSAKQGSTRPRSLFATGASSRFASHRLRLSRSAWAWSSIASPLFAADLGLGEGFIGLVLGLNSIIVALFAVPVATRMERAGPFRWLGWAALRGGGRARLLSARAAAPPRRWWRGPWSSASASWCSARRCRRPWRASRRRAAAAPTRAPGPWWAPSAWEARSSFRGLLRDSIGWTGAWLIYAAVAAGAGLLLLAARQRFLRAAPA